MASAMIAALFPLWIVVGLNIKLDSSGPVLTWKSRVGRGGKPIWVCQFRTLSLGHTSEDMGITRVGRLLLPTSLDLTPQLLNVLRGGISFVGSRLRPYHDHNFPIADNVADICPGIVPPVENQGKFGVRIWLKSIWSAVLTVIKELI
jgi:lipopolysaccharide/colanic/teichoic acid biosynthesis glycosyltransferase